MNIATFLDPRFKIDFVEGETLHDNIIDQGMEISSGPGVSDTAAGSQASHSNIQEGVEIIEPPTKRKKLLMFLQKESGSTDGTATLCNRTPIQKLQAEVEAYKMSPKLEIDSNETPI